MPSRDTPWPDASIALLRALWSAPEYQSIRAIAAKLHRSKSSVTRKVHRLGLPARPNPIKRSATGPHRRVVPAHRRGVSTLPPLASLAGAQ